MKKSKFCRRLLRSTVLSGAIIASLSPALAQDEDADDDVIIVTGTRLLTNPNLSSANPVLSVVDDILSVGTVLVAFLMPILIPVVVLIGFLIVRALYRSWRKGRQPTTVPTLSATRRT